MNGPLPKFSKCHFLLPLVDMYKIITWNLFLQIDENNLNDLSNRRPSKVKIGNSFTSVIESSDASLYSTDERSIQFGERRSSSRLGQGSFSSFLKGYPQNLALDVYFLN